MNQMSTVPYHIFAKISTDFDILFWLIVAAAAADSNDDNMKVIRLTAKENDS